MTIGVPREKGKLAVMLGRKAAGPGRDSRATERILVEFNQPWCTITRVFY